MALTPEQKASLDAIFLAWGVKDKADSDIAMAMPKALGLKDYIPHIERLLADPLAGPAVAAYQYRENCQQMLGQLQVRWPDEKAVAASIGAIVTSYPGLYTADGLAAVFVAMTGALTALASATAENIAAVVADIRADFSLLWS